MLHNSRISYPITLPPRYKNCFLLLETSSYLVSRISLIPGFPPTSITTPFYFPLLFVPHVPNFLTLDYPKTQFLYPSPSKSILISLVFSSIFMVLMSKYIFFLVCLTAISNLPFPNTVLDLSFLHFSPSQFNSISILLVAKTKFWSYFSLITHIQFARKSSSSFKLYPESNIPLHFYFCTPFWASSISCLEYSSTALTGCSTFTFVPPKYVFSFKCTLHHVLTWFKNTSVAYPITLLA